MRPHHKFWPRRLPHAITLPATSLWDNLATNARRYPDKPFIVYYDSPLSFSRFKDEAERLAGHLRHHLHQPMHQSRWLGRATR